MRTAILALIFAIPVSLTADLIGVVFDEAEASVEPCTAPIHAAPQVLPPKAKSAQPIRRPAERFIRAA